MRYLFYIFVFSFWGAAGFAEVDISVPDMSQLRGVETAARDSVTYRFNFSASSWAPGLDHTNAQSFERSHFPSLFLGFESAPLIQREGVSIRGILGLQPTLLEKSWATSGNAGGRELRQNIFLLPAHLGFDIDLRISGRFQFLTPFVSAAALPLWAYREKKGLESERQFFGLGADFGVGLLIAPEILKPAALRCAGHYSMGELDEYSLTDWHAEIGLSFSI